MNQALAACAERVAAATGAPATTVSAGAYTISMYVHTYIYYNSYTYVVHIRSLYTYLRTYTRTHMRILQLIYVCGCFARRMRGAGRGCRCFCPKPGTYKTVEARFWPWLSGESPHSVLSCSLFARKWWRGSLLPRELLRRSYRQVLCSSGYESGYRYCLPPYGTAYRRALRTTRTRVRTRSAIPAGTHLVPSTTGCVFPNARISPYEAPLGCFLTQLTNLAGQWFQSQANGSNVCRVPRASLHRVARTDPQRGPLPPSKGS